jgi:ribosomal protein S18 acetylase RimI-like enzyme
VPPGVIVRWSEQPDVRSYLLVEGGQPVAYGELWIDDDEAEVELARIVVDPRRRGQHLGRALARLLAEEAAGSYPDVFLRLVPGNTAALRSYSAAGFTRVDPEVERDWNRGQPVAYLWMAFSRREQPSPG